MAAVHVDNTSMARRGREFYEALGSPSTVLAPMVDQSEHSWRVLCRRHGTELAYTPMFSARQFVESEQYRRSIFGPLEGRAENEDLPLFVQFAANDPDILLSAAKHVQTRCSAVDINFGCPQKIAKRGHYGAWLSDEPQLQQKLVGTLHCHLDCPVTVKIRVQEAGKSATVDYARMLQAAGASVIAVHGRTREQKGLQQGAADWEMIRAVKEAVSVPVFANGGIFTAADVRRCLEATGADGVMAGEALLEDPALFEGMRLGDVGAAGSSSRGGGEAVVAMYEDAHDGAPAAAGADGAGTDGAATHGAGTDGAGLRGSHGAGTDGAGLRGSAQTSLAREYLALQATYPADLRSVKQHLFTLLYAHAQVHWDLRERLHRARTLEEMTAVVDECDARPPAARAPFCTAPGDGFTTWYRRHHWEALRHEMRQEEKRQEAELREQGEAAEGAADERLSKGQRKRMRQQRKRERDGAQGQHEDAEEEAREAAELREAEVRE